MESFTAVLIDHGISLFAGIFGTLYGYVLCKKNILPPHIFAYNSRMPKLLRIGGPLLILIQIILITNVMINHVPDKIDNPAELKQIAIGISKQLPMMPDDETRLESVTSENMTLIYHLKLINLVASEIDRTAFSDTMRTHLNSTISKNQDSMRFFKDGVTLTYKYRTSDDILISTIVFPPSSFGY